MVDGSIYCGQIYQPPKTSIYQGVGSSYLFIIGNRLACFSHSLWLYIFFYFCEISLYYLRNKKTNIENCIGKDLKLAI